MILPKVKPAGSTNKRKEFCFVMDILTAVSYIIGAVAGAAMGSFSGVVIDRQVKSSPRFAVEAGQKLKARLASRSKRVKSLSGRSRCSSCGHQLAWWENIPLLSFVLLRGKCRQCHSPIPYWLPLIEAAGAMGGIWVVWELGNVGVLGGIGAAAIAAALVAIFFSDLVYGIVPDWAVGLGSLGAVIRLVILASPMRLMGHMAAALGAGLFFLFLVLITRRRGMGTGDATLAFFLGLWLGWPVIGVGVWLGFAIGASWGLAMILLGRKKLGQTLPFGPFLIAGSLAARAWGQILLDKWF